MPVPGEPCRPDGSVPCAQYPRREGFDHVYAMATTLETDDYRSPVHVRRDLVALDAAA